MRGLGDLREVCPEAAGRRRSRPSECGKLAAFLCSSVECYTHPTSAARHTCPLVSPSSPPTSPISRTEMHHRRYCKGLLRCPIRTRTHATRGFHFTWPIARSYTCNCDPLTRFFDDWNNYNKRRPKYLRKRRSNVIWLRGFDVEN